jgi:hypothetical protein
MLAMQSKVVGPSAKEANVAGARQEGGSADRDVEVLEQGNVYFFLPPSS